MDYRTQITGWLPGPEGQVPVWVQPVGDLKLPVEFHGRTERDGGWVYLMVDQFAQGIYELNELDLVVERELLSQILWQLEALPEGARFEVHCSHPNGASALKELLDCNGVAGVDVVFTPAASALRGEGK